MEEAWLDVRSPYDDSVVGRVRVADAEAVDDAVARGLEALSEPLPPHRRAEILDNAAMLVTKRAEELAQTIAREAGKPVKTARIEVARTVEIMRFSAAEALKLGGEMVPMEAASAGEGKLGFTLRRPLGVVGAISPFNFPLNLVAHKLGPSIAAGNATVLKPAEQTPLSALKLGLILEDAGLPPGFVNLVFGVGPEAGKALVDNDDVAAISFTGSPSVGWAIRSAASKKRVLLELGSNAPLIVDKDGDWQTAADKASLHAFSNAGQSCISVQRILLHQSLAPPFTERFLERIECLTIGDPLDEATDVGPLISASARDRVMGWIEEAVATGGELLAGGELVDEGRCLAPTVIEDPPMDVKVWREEIFGPVATIHSFRTFDEAIALANDTRFGLQAGVFTGDIGRALEAADRLNFGGVLINEVPTFRADQMPYGGIGDAGNTREGPASAVRELTEERLVSLQESD